MMSEYPEGNDFEQYAGYCPEKTSEDRWRKIVELALSGSLSNRISPEELEALGRAGLRTGAFKGLRRVFGL